MAIAQEVYGASQQEIAAAVGKSQAWVSRVLQWRREGFKDDTPFGQASKAARVRAANYQATDKAVAKRAKPEANGVEAEAQVKDALVRAAELSRIACNGAALGTEAEPQEEAADDSGAGADELIEHNVSHEDFLRSAAEALRLARLYPDPACIPTDAEVKTSREGNFRGVAGDLFWLGVMSNAESKQIELLRSCACTKRISLNTPKSRFSFAISLAMRP